MVDRTTRIGRAGAGEKPRLLVLVMVDTRLGWGRRVLEGIIQYAREVGTWDFLYDPGYSNIAAQMRFFRQADGIIVNLPDPHERHRRAFEAVCGAGIPAVIPEMPAASPLTVLTNGGAIGRLAFRHLRDQGLRRFTFWSLPGRWYSVEREAGFRQAVEAAGLTYVPPLEVRASYGRWSQVDPSELEAWVASLPKPIGIFGSNADMARQVCLACHARGVYVPEEVAVIGCDDDEIVCGLTSPPLTVIDHGARRVGYETAALLDRLMKGEPPPQQPILVEPVGVIERQSTETFAIEDPDLLQAIQFIRTNAVHNLTAGDVVAHVQVARRKLEQDFKRRLGRTIYEEITRVRIARARELLLSSNLTLPAIAAQCGYSSASRLTEAFKRVSGIAPAAYRRQQGGA